MATEAQDRIAARDRVVARRRQVEAPSTVRDDSEDEMIVSFPEFIFKEFIAAVAMTVFLLVVSIWLQAPLLGQAVSETSWIVLLGTTILGCSVTFVLFARFRTRIAYWI